MTMSKWKSNGKIVNCEKQKGNYVGTEFTVGKKAST